MVELRYVYRQRVDEGAIRRDPAQEAVLPELERLRTDLAAAKPRRGFFGRKAPDPVKGVYLWGGVGTGKSFLMDMAVTHVGVPKRRVHFHAFMQEVHRGMDAARKRGVDDAIAPVADDVAKEIRLLALDEMQISDVADAMIVGRLFERLLDAGVALVTTSNRKPDDLYKDGLNREVFLPFIEIIKSRLTVWNLDGGVDYRQDRLSGETVYFAPNDAKAARQVDLLWQQMSGAPSGRDQSGGLTLTVSGREVHLPHFRNGVVRATFAELCDRPLGASDYLALADAARVVIIEDVPKLDQAQANPAKRFVTLIDALYEAGTKVILTAEAEPEGLYTDGTGAFEFERTASRLREMASADWRGAG